MKRKIICISILLIFIAMGSGCYKPQFVIPDKNQLDAMKNLAVAVKGKPNFLYRDAMKKEIFVPPAIDSMVRSAKDRKITEQLKPKDFLLIADQAFADVLIKNLKETKHFNEVKIADINGGRYDGLLEITIIAWGATTKAEDSYIILPFVSLIIEMTDSNGKSIWHEKKTMVNNTNRTLADYDDKIVFEKDFKEVIEKAGKEVSLLMFE
ncbi:MAG: hypothetical protein JEZ07_09855 [Phycisphaerae bacterium]|nr:hypothetical protein [Phycisphaerae bacterium]